MEMNNEVKLGQIFRPAGLTVSENLGSRKVGEVFVVSNDIY